jgi:meiotically up-regulated gene 157 (Mug157) protein
MTVAVLARLVQEYQIDQRDRFYEVEAKFDDALRAKPYFREGRRVEPIAAPHPANTMIWEATFESLAEAEAAFAAIDIDPDHIRLLAEQLPSFTRRWVEYYNVIEPDGTSR